MKKINLNRFVLTAIVYLSSFSAYSQYIIPVPIYTNNIGVNPKAFIGTFFAVNLFFILYFITRIIVYLFIKKDIQWTTKWYEFVFIDKPLVFETDRELNAISWVFLTINGIAIVLYTAIFIINTFMS